MRGPFVAAMRAAVSGVTVVTTDGPGGRRGLTVSSMASVSADPPTLLVCVTRRSPLVAAIRANGVFAVGVLGAHQAGVAEVFAGRTSGERFGFGCARWEAGASGAPLLAYVRGAYAAVAPPPAVDAIERRDEDGASCSSPA
jgi:flavin reductase (DIM6/NTAB) family NADH-FMN oxidoreductase RutF